MGEQSGIDWANVRRQLEDAAAAAEEAFDPSPERAAALLSARARKLAQLPDAPQEDGTVTLLKFRRGSEWFGVEVRFVREVTGLGPLAAVPGTPEFLTGVTIRRGKVLAVFDLSGLFGSAAETEGASPRLLVLGQEREELAILVDEAHEHETIIQAHILDPSGGVADKVRNKWIRGITKDALIVLDGAAFLADPRLTIDMRDGAGRQTEDVEEL
ncbi:MAG: chemotaxis protein CheW [Woeseia sp.]